MKTPTTNGYYWLVQDRLRTQIVYVQDGRFYRVGRLFGQPVSKVRQAEWYGPLVFGRVSGDADADTEERR